MITIQNFCGFIFKDHLSSTLELQMHCECFQIFEDLIFADKKLPTKTIKIVSLRICTYKVYEHEWLCAIAGISG